MFKKWAKPYSKIFLRKWFNFRTKIEYFWTLIVLKMSCLVSRIIILNAWDIIICCILTCTWLIYYFCRFFWFGIFKIFEVIPFQYILLFSAVIDCLGCLGLLIAIFSLEVCDVIVMSSYNAYFLNGSTSKKKNCIKCAIAKYEHCKQSLGCTNNANKIREISSKKFWLLSWTPQRFRQIHAPGFNVLQKLPTFKITLHYSVQHPVFIKY